MISLSEVLPIEVERRKQKKTRAKKRKELGWVDLECNNGQWTPITSKAPSAGASICSISKNASLMDIFLNFLPPKILVACRKNLGGKTKLQFRNRCLSLAEVYEMLAIDIYFRAERPVVEAGTEKSVLEVAFRKVREKWPDVMGVKKYQYIHNHLYITTDVARGKLSKNLRRYLTLGQFVSLDEKQKKWRGKSKCIKKCPNKKNDPIGHWNTQATALLHTSELPFVFGIYPFSGSRKLGDNHEQRCNEIWTWIRKLLNNKNGKRFSYPVVCSDTLYLDNQSRDDLRGAGVPFHCSIKPDRFRYITEHLKPKVKEMDSWAGMENEKTGEVAIYNWSSEEGVGKKFLLSSALKKDIRKSHPQDIPPGWYEYMFMFDGCDTFNRYISSYLSPYRNGRWQMHFHDLFLAHILLNTAHTWKELKNKSRSSIDRKTILLQLASALYKKAKSNNIHHNHW